MAVGCGAKCSKFLLIFFNIIFWLSGCVILGIGIWMTVDQSIVDNLKILTVEEDDPTLQYAAYVLIAMGCFVFLVGFLGCCGAIKESKCMLGLYIFFLLLIMAGELAAGILALVYKDKILETGTDVLVTKLQNDTIYTVDDDNKVTFTAFGLAMSVSQLELKCCGINGSKDYANSAFSKANEPAPFPLTCCVMKDDSKDLTDGMDLAANVEDEQKCYTRTDGFFYDKGCKQGLEDFFSANAIILIGIGIGIACLELIGMIISCVLIRNLGEEV